MQLKECQFKVVWLPLTSVEGALLMVKLLKDKGATMSWSESRRDLKAS